jgi:predicted Zn-dependent peptidase
VHRDFVVLDLVSDVLSGRTGRLYKSLVLGQKLANEISAGTDGKRYEGAFEVEGTVKEGQEPGAVEAAVYQEIEKLAREPLPKDELQKVKNQYKANAFRRLSSPFSIMVQLLVYDGLGDWKYINDSPDRADAVTAEDVQRAAREYLTRENRTVGIFLRQQAAPGPESNATQEPKR